MKSQKNKLQTVQAPAAALLPGDVTPADRSAALLMRPAYLPPSAWTEHLPFAFWIIDTLRPRSLVELGTHEGASYFGFCQAVERFTTNTACYAIDTWKGDEQTGFYDEEVYRRVSDHNRKNYSGFSSLIRSSFDDALPYFPDGSIDLLHIDGLHTYEAIKHDFESWLPKLSDRAVVLMHDTNVRERDFGVFQFYAQLSKQYPSFEFLHGHGLGVVGVGSDLREGLRALFEASGIGERALGIRRIFAHLGENCQDRLSLNFLQSETVRLEGIIKTERSRIKALEERLVEQRESAATKLQALNESVSRLQAEAQARPQKTAAEIAALQDKHKQDLAQAVQAAREAEGQAQRQKAAGEITALQDRHKQDLAQAVQAAREAESQAQRQKAAGESAALLDRHKQDLAQAVQSAREAENQAQRQKAAGEIAALQDKHKQELAQAVQTAREAEGQALRQKTSGEIAALQDRHKQDLAQAVQAAREAEGQALRQKAADEIAALEEKHKQDLALAVQTAREAEGRAQRQKAAAESAALQDKHEQDLAQAVQAAREAEGQAQRQKAATEIAALQDKHKQDLAQAIQAAREAEGQAQRQKAAAEITGLQEKHKQDLVQAVQAAREAEGRAQRQKAAAEISALQDKHTQDLAQAVQDALETEGHAHRQKLADEIAALRSSHQQDLVRAVESARDAEANNRRLSAEMGELVRRLAEVQDTHRAKQTALQDAKRTADDLSRRFENLQAERIRLEEVIKTERGRIKALEERLMEQRTSSTTEIRLLNEALSRLQTELNDLRQSAANDMAALREQHQQELAQAVQAQRETEAKNQRMSAEMGELTRRLAEVQSGQDKVNHALQAAEKRASDVTKRFEKLEVQVRAERLAVKARQADMLENARRLVRVFAPAHPSGAAVAISPRLRALVRRLEEERLVDEAWYLENNPDVREAGMAPARHYVLHGASENRLPRDMAKPVA